MTITFFTDEDANRIRMTVEDMVTQLHVVTSKVEGVAESQVRMRKELDKLQSQQERIMKTLDKLQKSRNE